jgi:predicted Zn-ribbon and HTH transcriptional regulator
LKFSGIPLTALRLNKKSAAHLVTIVGGCNLSARGIHFRCPAKSRLKDFHHDCSYKMFVSHVSKHESKLLSMGLNVCPFGCKSGFFDALQQVVHIKTRCPKVSSMAAEDAK